MATPTTYELMQPTQVKVRMRDSLTMKPSVANIQAGAGLRCRVLRVNHKRNVIVLAPVGDPTTEIETSRSTWGRWQPV